MPFQKKYIPWNKGKKHTKEHIEKVRKTLWGRKLSDETKEKIRKAHIGMKTPLATRIQMSKSRQGENAPGWRGGRTKERDRIRGSLQYKLWRESVYIRDIFTCVWCGANSENTKGVILNADHIKPFALYPELRFAIDNGRTLCLPCHKTTDSYLNNKIRRE